MSQTGPLCKVCRSTNVNYPEERNDEPLEEEVDNDNEMAENYPVAFAEFTSTDGWEEFQMDKLSVIAISKAFEAKNTDILTEYDLNGHRVNLKTRTEVIFAILELGSPMSVSNLNILEETARNLACYNGEYILPNGRLIIAKETGGWKIQSASFITVDNQKQT